MIKSKIKVGLKHQVDNIDKVNKIDKVDNVNEVDKVDKINKENEVIDEYIPLLLERYIENVQLFSRINEKLINNKHLRNDNFPSHISENIVKFAINAKYYQCNSKQVKWNTRSGDLEFEGLKYEVKAFMSTGPSSFGPTEYWDKIFFLDGIKILNRQIIVYEIELSSIDPTWKKIKVNSTETYEDHCIQGRRPRIQFDKIKSQIPTEKITIIYQGSVTDLFYQLHLVN